MTSPEKRNDKGESEGEEEGEVVTDQVVILGLVLMTSMINNNLNPKTKTKPMQEGGLHQLLITLQLQTQENNKRGVQTQ